MKRVRGAKISNLSYLAATMYQLIFGGGGNIWGNEKLQGGAKTSYKGRQKPIRKTKKIVATFFIFLETVKFLYFVGAPKISAGGRRMVNMVTGFILDQPLVSPLTDDLYRVTFDCYVIVENHRMLLDEIK